MDFFEAVNNRYSYRGEFCDEKLSDEDITKILNAALAAPTGMRIQTSSYVAITDEKLIHELGQIINRNGTKTAPFILVMLSENESGSSNMNFEIENYCAACENVLLAVTALGYSTVWTDGIMRNSALNDSVRKILNIPKKKTIRAVLPIGKALNPESPKIKDSIDKRVIFKK